MLPEIDDVLGILNGLVGLYAVHSVSIGVGEFVTGLTGLCTWLLLRNARHGIVYSVTALILAVVCSLVATVLRAGGFSVLGVRWWGETLYLMILVLVSIGVM